jgi:hypothetical protein
MEMAEKFCHALVNFQPDAPTINLRGGTAFQCLFELSRMVSAESLAFGRGITRKLQGFGGNRNIFAARR